MAVRAKKAPLGICDLCGEPFPPGVSWFTTKGTPRLYCSDTCKATANSRAGAPIRSRKARERVRRGEWQNPSPLLRADATPEEIETWRRKVAGGVSRARQQEVTEGCWHNPALSEEARRKLSRPRKHTDDPVLHSAMEKLTAGLPMADLTTEEQEAYRAYRRRLRRARADEVRAYYRRRYRVQMATEGGRARLREKWRQQRARLEQRVPNRRLIEARQAAGLSQAALARAVGVSQTAVSKWERFGAIPRSPEVRRRVEEMLGKVWP